MSGSLKLYRKTAIERRRLYIDYSCWLEGAEKLTAFQVNVTPYTEAAPIVVSTSYTDITNTKLTLFVSGGAAGTQYVLGLVVQTDGGQTKEDDIGVVVTS